MKKQTSLLLAFVAVVGLAATASASSNINIALDPVSSTNVTVGGNITFNVDITNLKGDTNLPGSPSLAGFDIYVNYDSSALSFQSATINTNYFNFGGGDFSWIDGSTSGQVYLSDLSYDPAAAIVAGQTSAFTLGSITFQAAAPGTNSLSIDPTTALTDENAHSLTFTTSGSSVSAVPEPSSVVLMVLGLVALALVAYRRSVIKKA